jgi:hypothetical protein
MQYRVDPANVYHKIEIMLSKQKNCISIFSWQSKVILHITTNGNGICVSALFAAANLIL